MCGIAGFFSKNKLAESRIDSTLRLMKNRGPNHQSSQIYHSNLGFSIGLLHARLSIIDLDSRSHQPFTIASQTIVYNGEIYNYLELRKALLDQNIELLTSSDTEVLLHYYRLYGKDCVNHFEGMWAFAIYDQSSEELFLSRDRFAEKPLYFYKNNEGFFFGSEVKFLQRLVGQSFSVNHRHLMRHIAHGYKALYKSDESYFCGVEELKYAQSLCVNQKGVGEPYRYWNPPCEIDSSMSLQDAIEGTRAKLLESVRLRLRADVPLAFCLSGGVDSAAIVSIAAKEFGADVTTFSIIEEDERYDERDNILSTVNDLNCDHHLISATQVQPLERLMKLVDYHDAPVATLSYYVHSMISEAVHQGGFKVSFSGTSADELFTGYYDHFILHLNEVRSHESYCQYLNDWRENIGQFIRNPDLKDADLYFKNPNFRNHIFDASEELEGYFLQPFKEAYKEKTFTDNLLRNRMLNELFYEATPVILHEDDLNSMFYSVENRSPYLDTELQKFAYSIPARHLIQKGYGKYILREAVAGILNDKVRLDRRKKGFNASINSIVNLQDKKVKDFILDDSSELYSLIDQKKVSSLLEQANQPNHFSKFIFSLINAKIFLEIN